MQSILVTGANKGIGLAVVKAILQEQPQYCVFLGSRDGQRGEVARDLAIADNEAYRDRLHVVALDVCKQDSVHRATTQLQESGHELYALVNNAGIATGSLSQILDVNAYGMQRVSEQLLPLIKDGGRVINVASASGPNYVAQCSKKWQEFFQNHQTEWPQLDKFMQNCQHQSANEMEQLGLPSNAYYGLSKACANLINIISARNNPRLTINACTPGYIETDLTYAMTGASGTRAVEMGMKQPSDGARVIMHLLFEPIDNTGHYFGSDCRRSPIDHYRAPGTTAYVGE